VIKMSELLVKEKDLVFPGDELATGLEFIPSNGTYRYNNKIYSKTTGLVNIQSRVVKVICLKGPYIPERGDVVIGKVTDIGTTYWMVDIGIPYSVYLPLKSVARGFVDSSRTDITRFLNLDDLVILKIFKVSNDMKIDGSMRGPEFHKLTGGRLIEINSHKVPRLIGRKGSMIQMIKQHTKCKIIVGQNGWIWIKGEEPELEHLAIQTIKKVDLEYGFDHPIYNNFGTAACVEYMCIYGDGRVSPCVGNETLLSI